MSPTHRGQGGDHGQRGWQGERHEYAANAATHPRVAKIELASHLIREITYDPATQILEVEHRLKGRRRYFDVPPAVVLNLITAPSPGWYYTQHIRDAFPRDDGAHWHFSFSWRRSRSHHH